MAENVKLYYHKLRNRKKKKRNSLCRGVRLLLSCFVTTFVAPEGAAGNLINCLKGYDLGQVVLRFEN